MEWWCSGAAAPRCSCSLIDHAASVVTERTRCNRYLFFIFFEQDCPSDLWSVANSKCDDGSLCTFTPFLDHSCGSLLDCLGGWERLCYGRPHILPSVGTYLISSKNSKSFTLGKQRNRNKQLQICTKINIPPWLA